MPRFINTEDLSFYDIPAGVTATLEAHKVPAVVPAGIQKDVSELYKFEYERGAQRYNDLYTAAWTNFSYMAIVAGAILTFGGDRFVPELSALLACLPLLFWWLATFEPLNRYGDQVIDRLSQLESLLNTGYNLEGENKLSHYTNFKEREGKFRPLPDGKNWWPRPKCHNIKLLAAVIIFLLLLGLALEIFGVLPYRIELSLLFAVLIPVVLIGIILIEYCRCGHEWEYIRSQFRRVRFVVRCFACLLLITAICFSSKILKEGKPLVVRKDTEVKVIPVDFNNNVGVKLDGITAKQAQELLEQAEKQKAPPTPAK